MLTVSEQAPLDIKLIGPDGNQTSLRDFLGKYLVLYFYPKDDTPGCTKEACNFRDSSSEIRALGAEILGVSKDLPDSHTKFKEKYQLNFPLLSDPDNTLQTAMGVWMEKSMFGRKYMGTQRATFILDPQGVIAHVWEEVNPITHATEVIKVLQDLTNATQ